MKKPNIKINKTMKKIAVFYILTFILTFVAANYMLNYEQIHPAKNQGETTLNRLYVKSNSMKINEMNAYVDAMDPSYLRLSVTPVSETKKVTLQMFEPETAIKTIRYQLMDDTNTTLIEEGECPAIQRVEGERQTEIAFESDLKEGTEYCLNLVAEDEAGKSYNYYTRVIYGTNLKMYDKLKFVMDFHTATFSKAANTSLAEYLAYSSDDDSSDFRNVSIYTDSETVTWGNLAPEVTSSVDVTVLNADSDTAEIQLVYEIIASDEEGNDYNYMVKEIYDVSTMGSSMELIGYYRTMDEKLDEQSFYFENGELRLGLVNMDEMDMNVYGKQEPEVEETEEAQEMDKNQPEEEYNTYISFVADGALWVYNTKDNVLTQAFGFENKNQTGMRESSYLDHGIKILQTKDNGDIVFAVYGYMYNGDNEGRFGIQINEYNRAAATYSERTFIPYNRSFELLDQGIQKMGFVDNDNRLYISLEDKVYQIDTITKDYGILIDDVDNEECAISDSGQSVVISHRDDTGRITQLEWANLLTGDVRKIQAQKDTFYMIGILSDNLVYGVADAETQSGRMDVIYIVDFDLNKLKEYTVDGGYISDAEISEDNVLQIWRRKSDNTNMESDYIVYNEQNTHEIEYYNIYQSLRMRETWLYTDTMQNDLPIFHYARGIESYNDTEVAFEAENDRYMGYFVSYGDELIKCENFRDAYVIGYENDGRVLDYQGRIILRPTTRLGEKTLNGPTMDEVGEDVNAQQREVIEWLAAFEKLDVVPSLESTSMLENIKAAFPDYTVVNLSGMALNRALTMVSEGSPLVVKNSEGTWCVIDGYSSGYIEVADPKDGTKVRYNRDSVIEGIASSGNVIYSFLRN